MAGILRAGELNSWTQSWIDNTKKALREYDDAAREGLKPDFNNTSIEIGRILDEARECLAPQTNDEDPFEIFGMLLGKDGAREFKRGKFCQFVREFLPFGVGTAYKHIKAFQDFQAGIIAVRPPDHVYFIQAGDSGPIKIGWSKNIARRLIRLGNEHYEELHLRATLPGSLKREKAIQRRYKEHQVRGEWFHPVPEILAHIDKINASKEAS